MRILRIMTCVAAMLLAGLAAKGQVHVEVGTGLSDIRGDYPQTGGRQSAVAGIGYGVRISDRWIVDPAVQLTLEGKEKHGTGNCKVPVSFLYCTGRFRFGAGPFISYRIWEETNEDWYCIYPPTYPDKLDGPDVYDYKAWRYKKFDAGVMGKMTYMMKKVYLGLEGSCGIRDIGRQFGSFVINGHTMSANIIVGYMF